MVEKKKKRGEKPLWLSILHRTFTVLVVLPVLLMAVAVFVIWLAKPVMDSTDAIYPAPPERIEISSGGRVIDAHGKPVLLRNVGVNMVVPAGKDGGGYENKSSIPSFSTFAGSHRPFSASTGCVWGYIEIDGYPHYDFEFGMDHIEFGGAIDFTFIVAEAGITSKAVITPSEIKPALAPEPVIYPGCRAR